MTRMSEPVTEEMWSSATALLWGKEFGYRILVWINYDLMSMCRKFFILEKTHTTPQRLEIPDYPLPVFWDHETVSSTRRREAVETAIATFSFQDMPMIAPTIEDDTGWRSDIEEDDMSIVDDQESVGSVEEPEDYPEEEPEVEEPDDYPEEEPEVEESDEKEELPENYLQRQFELYLRDVDASYHPMARQTFQQQVESMVEALRSQR